MAESLLGTDISNRFYDESDEELEVETTEEEESITDEIDDVEESEEELEETEEDAEGTYDYDGREITAGELQEWEQASKDIKHFQADYSRKTAAFATQSKAEQARQEELTQSLEESIEGLESLLSAEEDAINWDELDDDDPGQANKLRRKFEKRSKDLKAAKSKAEEAKTKARGDYLSEQQVVLAELIPDWYDNGQPSDTQSKDFKLIGPYLQNLGFTNEEINDNFAAKDWVVYRDAARYAELQKKKPAIKKQVKKAPKMVKGGKKASSKKERSEADTVKLFYG